MIVFDVNIDVFQSLYMVESRLPRRVLYQIQVPAQAHKLGWRNEVVDEPTKDGRQPSFRLVRKIMFPGWFCTFGFVTMPWLAQEARKHCRVFLGHAPEIGVFYSPYYLPMQKALRPKITVYHPIDDYTVYWPKRAARTLRLEGEMIRRSDLVLCTGLYLRDEFQRKFPDHAHKIHHLPNPVPEEFLVATPPNPRIFSNDPSGGAKATLGYVGSFHQRLETKAICALAAALPCADIKLRMDMPNPDPFSRYPNIHYVERMGKEDLMKMVRSFDVCLVPQLDSYFNKVASPRKMYEYLASSRPIVTLNTPEAVPLAPYVRNTSSVEEFVREVQAVLTKGEPEHYPTQRLSLASKLTAKSLAERYAALLDEVLEQNAS
jgi:hypothetical protein